MAAEAPAGATAWVQRTVTLPQHKRGCHIITNKIYDAIPEITEFEVGGAQGLRIWARGSSGATNTQPTQPTHHPTRHAHHTRVTPPHPPKVGLANLFLLHTSASLTINENASPDVLLDLNVRRLCRMVYGVVWYSTANCL